MLRIGQSRGVKEKGWGRCWKSKKEVKAVKEDTSRGECPWLKIQPRKKDHKKGTYKHQEKIKEPAGKKKKKRRKVEGEKKKLR